MRKICLALPTNRPCSDTILALHDEAAYAAGMFGVEVHLLILDSSDAATRDAHRRTVDSLPQTLGIVVHLLDEATQRTFLAQAISQADLIDTAAEAPAASGGSIATAATAATADHLLALMLPDGVSYGACTNRVFLIAAALGCESVHRRDSDSQYQTLDDRPAFPIHHELAAIGKRAREITVSAAATGANTNTITESTLPSDLSDRTVSLVGASFVGELSVDISEIEQLDSEVYHEVVGLWAPMSWTDEQKRDLVSESFRGAGNETLVKDHSTLCLVDPMRIDMCNIAFHHDTYERVPLLPALDTIGSDYFLMHAIHDAGLPGVLHNRHIVNYYTEERRTDAGFIAYQTRFAKFFLSMLYLNHIYDRMGTAGTSLLDVRDRLRTDTIAALARESAALDRSENRWRLDVIERCYRKLGGRYADFAELLESRGAELIDRAKTDIEEFALLTEAWPALVRGSRAAAGALRRQPGPGRIS